MFPSTVETHFTWLVGWLPAALYQNLVKIPATRRFAGDDARTLAACDHTDRHANTHSSGVCKFSRVLTGGPLTSPLRRHTLLPTPRAVPTGYKRKPLSNTRFFIPSQPASSLPPSIPKLTHTHTPRRASSSTSIYPEILRGQARSFQEGKAVYSSLSRRAG
jgi:hypothetical protein